MGRDGLGLLGWGLAVTECLNSYAGAGVTVGELAMSEKGAGGWIGPAALTSGRREQSRGR